MKRFTVSLLLGLGFSFSFVAEVSALSPDSSNKMIILKVNALPIIFGSFNVFGEVKVNSSSSVCIGGNYWYSKKGTLIFNRFDQQHSGLTTELRKYVDNTALKGFYVAGYLKYRHILQKEVVNFIEDSLGSGSIETPPQNQNWNQLGLGALFGFQHIFPSGFIMEGYGGLGYFFYSKISTDHPEWLTNFSKASRIDLRVGISLGYAF